MLALPTARAQLQPGRQNGQSAPQLPLQPDATRGNDGNDVPAAATGILPPSGGNGSSQVQPDTHVLSGAEMLGLGSLRAHLSFFDPVLRITEGADTGLAPGKTDSTSLFGGGFALDQQWSRSHLIVQYYGSKLLDYPDSVFDSSYHNLSFSQTITLGRWVFRLRDDLLVSPQANFGGLDITGAPLPAFDAALTSVTPQLEPAQTIQTGWAERVDNTPLAEVDYSPFHSNVDRLLWAALPAFRFYRRQQPSRTRGIHVPPYAQRFRRDNVQLFSYAFCWHTQPHSESPGPSFFCALDSRTLGSSGIGRPSAFSA